MPRRSAGTLVAGGVLACAATGALLASSGSPGTYALFSDYTVAEARVGAGTWEPPPPVVPAACGPVSDYPGGVVVGTDGPDTISAGNQGQVVLGLDGDDVLVGGNAKDCLVGGAGDDELHGSNGKDVLDGGDGDDVLVGGNGQDTCLGGSGSDELAQCEEGDPVGARGAPAPQPASQPTAPSSEPVSEPVAPPQSADPTGSTDPSEPATVVTPAD